MRPRSSRISGSGSIRMAWQNRIEPRSVQASEGDELIVLLHSPFPQHAHGAVFEERKIRISGVIVRDQPHFGEAFSLIAAGASHEAFPLGALRARPKQPAAVITRGPARKPL